MAVFHATMFLQHLRPESRPDCTRLLPYTDFVLPFRFLRRMKKRDEHSSDVSRVYLGVPLTPQGLSQAVFFQVALRGVSRLAKTAFANICFFGAVACVLASA